MLGSTNATGGGGGSSTTYYLKVSVTGSTLTDLSDILITATPRGSDHTVVQNTTNASGETVLIVVQGEMYTISASKSDYEFLSTTDVTILDPITECSIEGNAFNTIIIYFSKSNYSPTVTITATCEGQTTQTRTATLPNLTPYTVSFSGLATGSWTFEFTYTDNYRTDSVTVDVADGNTVTQTVNVQAYVPSPI